LAGAAEECDMRARQVELTVEARTEVGKKGAKRVRASGSIPAVVYGRGVKPVPVAVDAAAFASALPESAWRSTLINLRLEGAAPGASEDPGRAVKKPARPGSKSSLRRGATSASLGAGLGEEPSAPPATVMIADVQRDLLRRDASGILAIDFHRVSLQEIVRAHVPVIAVGESPGVKRGGVLEHILHEIEVECLPTALPDHVEADVSGLDIGDTCRVKDLEAIPDVKILAHDDDVLLVVAPPTKAPEAAPAPTEAATVVAETPEPEVIRKKEEE